MAESRDKQELFKDMLLELMVSNETLGKIEQHTLNTADLSLESAVNMESLVSEIKSLCDDLNKNYSSGTKEESKKMGSLGIKDSSNLLAISKETASTAFHTFNMIGILEGTYGLTKDILTALQTNQLTSEEDRIENKKAREKQAAVAPAANKEHLKGGLGDFGIMGALAAIAGIVTGFIVGIVSRAMKMFSAISAGISKILNLEGLMVKIRDIGAAISNFFKESKIGKAFKNFITPIEEFFVSLTAEGSIISKVKGMFSSVKKFFGPIGDLFKMFSGEGTIIGKLIGYFGKITEFFSHLGGIFKFFMKIGKVIGKLSLIGGTILGVFDGIMAAIDIFQKTGNIGDALEAGIVGFINSFTGDILDLFKDTISWLAGALGFKEVEKILDSFSFADIIAEYFHRFVKAGKDVFEQYFQNIVDVFSDIGDKLMKGDIIGAIGEVFRGFLKTIATLLLDIPKNLLASVAEAVGLNSVGKSMREFSFSGLLGGTHTKTGGETQSADKSILGAAADTTAAKRKEKETKKALEKAKEGVSDTATDTAEKLMPGANEIINKGKELLGISGNANEIINKGKELLGISGNANEIIDKGKELLGISGNANEGFMDSLFRAYNENVGAVSDITPSPSTTGSEISAIQSDTANANMAASIMPVEMASSGGSGGGNNVSNNSSSVTYQNNNIPDRTSWMLRPIFGGM